MGTPSSNSGHSLPHLLFEIRKGNVRGHSIINKFGSNYQIDTATIPEDIWTHGGTWVPPTQARIHDIASTGANGAQDAGTVVASGTATSTTTNTLVDNLATFISSGVVAGDAVLNDSMVGHGYVQTVDSENQITIAYSKDDFEHFSNGDSYRVVHAAATGASVVLVDRCLDSNWSILSEYIVLNGLTAVQTASSYTRIHRMRVVHAASYTTPNLGTITATAQVDGTVTAEIVNSTLHPNGMGQTAMAIYTVPAGHTAFLLDKYWTSNRLTTTAGAMSDVSLRARSSADVSTSPYQEKYHAALSLTGNSSIERAYQAWEKYGEKTDLIMYADRVTDNSSAISAGFDLILVDNNYL